MYSPGFNERNGPDPWAGTQMCKGKADEMDVDEEKARFKRIVRRKNQTREKGKDRRAATIEDAPNCKREEEIPSPTSLGGQSDQSPETTTNTPMFLYEGGMRLIYIYILSAP
ncbi:hypothetical protein V5O48_014604 [Marasmius crinis-equi]|uniref:Uncharacterized protein n=1 Tax=Marasmius crinis-equi TaxID=585013 RepID=A0ABR3EWT5_9AGAR